MNETDLKVLGLGFFGSVQAYFEVLSPFFGLIITIMTIIYLYYKIKWIRNESKRR